VGDGGVELSHHATLAGVEGWTGEVVFTYDFGRDHLLEGPEELMNWEEKARVETEGCDGTSSFDFEEDMTILTIELVNVTCTEVEIMVHLSLMELVERFRPYTVPLLKGGGDHYRFSLVTARSNLPINMTKVVVHLAEGNFASNLLPTENVTILPRVPDRQSVFWSFGEGSAAEARVFLEFGPRGKLGRVTLMIVLFAVLGLVLVVVKLFLRLYEESVTY
jgi:hypothetical protein